MIFMLINYIVIYFFIPVCSYVPAAEFITSK